jgi:hypothetical protein
MDGALKKQNLQEFVKTHFDEDVPYPNGEIMHSMNDTQEAGYILNWDTENPQEIGIVTVGIEPEDWGYDGKVDMAYNYDDIPPSEFSKAWDLAVDQ